MKNRLKEKVIRFEDTVNVLKEIMMRVGLDESFFKLAFERLQMMLRMLEVTEN